MHQLVAMRMEAWLAVPLLLVELALGAELSPAARAGGSHAGSATRRRTLQAAARRAERSLPPTNSTAGAGRGEEGTVTPLAADCWVGEAEGGAALGGTAGGDAEAAAGAAKWAGAGCAAGGAAGAASAGCAGAGAASSDCWGGGAEGGAAPGGVAGRDAEAAAGAAEWAGAGGAVHGVAAAASAGCARAGPAAADGIQSHGRSVRR